jgi:hypothetical protein
VQGCLDACETGNYDWVFWTESDVWVTNFLTQLEEVIHAAGAGKHMIVSYDAIGNINAGSGFVKCSAVGTRALQEMLRIKRLHENNVYVKAWEANGAIILLYERDEWKQHIHVMQPRTFCSYPKYVPDWTRFEADDPQFWQPGDFLIHFAGFYKGGMFSFARETVDTGEPEFITMFA